MKLRLGTLLAVLLVTACQPAGLSTPGPVTESTAAPTAEQKSTAPAPSATPGRGSPVPATPVAASSVCVPPAAHAALPAGPFDDYPLAIRDYLNAGATPGELDQALYENGVANQPIAVASGDLTGDGRDEVVVSLFDPVSSFFPTPGRLMIYVCQEGRFELNDTLESGDLEGAPHIWYLQDLDADGAAELVVSLPSCGAHTCFDDVKILAWDGAGFQDRMRGSTLDLPYPDVRVEDPDMDGVYDVVVEASGYGSVGAGPQRSLARVWIWDPDQGAWEVGREVPGPSNYRVHVLADAAAAAKAGELEQALLLYRRVVDDATLEDWMDPEGEQANLRAFARFRIVVMYTQLGEMEFAEAAFQELEVTYLETSPQRPFVEMAREFRKAAASSGIEAGCAAAQSYAATHAGRVLQPLGSSQFGYANPDYTPADVCP